MTWHSVQDILRMHAERIDNIEQHLTPDARVVIDAFEAKYGVRAPLAPSPNTTTTPGLMTFTTLRTKD